MKCILHLVSADI